MEYNLLLSHKFDRDFSRLEKALQGKVVECLRELIDNPHAGKQLKGKLKGLRSWRAGEYRIFISNTGRKTTDFCYICKSQKACIRLMPPASPSSPCPIASPEEQANLLLRFLPNWQVQT